MGSCELSFFGKKVSPVERKKPSPSFSLLFLSSSPLLTSVEAPDVFVPDVERAAVAVALVAVARVAIAVWWFFCLSFFLFEFFLFEFFFVPRFQAGFERERDGPIG